MATQRFLALISGKIKEVIATVTSAGAANAGNIPALDDTGRLDASVMPAGIGADTKTLVAFEGLAAGDFVNQFLDGGTLKVRKADATAAGKEADGFVLAAVALGGDAVVYPLAGSNTQLAGLTIGGTYYLATTAGSVVSVAPSGAGNVVQKLGKAVTTSELIVSANDPYYLA